MFNYYSSPWLVKYIALHTLNYYSVIIINLIVSSKPAFQYMFAGYFGHGGAYNRHFISGANYYIDQTYNLQRIALISQLIRSIQMRKKV